jgi:VanZ family protein
MQETKNGEQPPMIAERVGSARRVGLLWLPAVAWAVVIFGFSSLRASQVPSGLSVQGHVGEYFIFGALLTLPLLRVWRGRKSGFLVAVLLATVIASAYGVTDELHQKFVPGRTPDPVDWADDTAGAAAGAATAAVVAWAVRRTRERRAAGGRRP